MGDAGQVSRCADAGVPRWACSGPDAAPRRAGPRTLAASPGRGSCTQRRGRTAATRTSPQDRRRTDRGDKGERSARKGGAGGVRMLVDPASALL